MSVTEVLNGTRRWLLEQGDCLAWLASLPSDCADLCFFSPPYETARTYGINFALRDQEWVDWMIKVFNVCLRVCNGLVACVCDGQTRNFRYSAVPALLMADLHRAGVHLRKPPIYHRSGIPGSGGPDWLRNDYEFIICASRGGKLPWSDNTAMGHPPKWAPGGEMSNRLSNGTRVNQWGRRSCSGQRRRDGSRQPAGRPSHKFRHAADGTVKGSHEKILVSVANPGNVIHCNVGGGQMGSKLAHKNEAPFPEPLAEFFVRSFCRPGGVIIDPFMGSGTTGAIALRWARRFLGCDIRQSQVDIAKRRLAGETPMMFETG